MLGQLLSQKATLIFIGVVLVLIVVTSWLLWQRRTDNPLAYLPDSTQVAVAADSRGLDQLSSMSWPGLAAVQTWRQLMPRADDMQYLVWGYSDEPLEESLLVVYRRAVPSAVRQSKSGAEDRIRLPHT